MPARRKTSSSPSDDLPSFEDAVSLLEEIVSSLEHERLPLDQLVSKYEQGSALLNHCDSILKSAKKRIDLITLKNQSTAADDTDTPAPPHTTQTGLTAGQDDDDDIRLF